MSGVASEGVRPVPLAGYEDWPAAVRTAPPYEAADEASTALARVLGVRPPTGRPDVVVEDAVEHEDVEVRRLRWSVGFGPDTRAWLLRPAGSTEPLPGVLGLHAHGGVRSVGGEQLVDLGAASGLRARQVRASGHGGRAPANDLARRGHAVLVHDTFSWGSRRFDLSRPTPRLAALARAQEALWAQECVVPTDDERFDHLSGLHEETLAKAAGVLGSTFAGTVLADDLVALDVLAGLDDVEADRLGTFGFSGGGGRSLLLAALDHRVRASVVTCMMATFASLVPGDLDTHSWLLHAPGLWSFAEWPDLTRLGRARFLVQYGREDPLFPPDGMRAAHERLLALHPDGDRYRGTFSDAGHVFDAGLQAEAWAFLGAALAGPVVTSHDETAGRRQRSS
jgi:dienelactone hydrolase